MIKIGLTGGIGCGKSTVCDFFHTHFNVDIIDADAIAKHLTSKGSPALILIGDQLGREFITEHNELNRALLKEAIFQSPNLKKRLEDILHPMIRDKIFDEVSKAKGHYCLIDIPLLAENYEQYAWLNRVVVVDIPHVMQVDRLKTRDNLSDELIARIIHQQAKREDRLRIAHDIIDNSHDKAHTLYQVKKLHHLYLSL